MRRLRWLSFGAPAALVTSLGLIVGLDAATASRASVISMLLIIGIADNLTDSLSVHMYQESERLPERKAFRTTIANYIARFGVCLSFVLLLLLPTSIAILACGVWGLALLSGLSYLLAKARGVRALPEILKHVGVALGVIAVSKAIGVWVQSMVGSG